MSVREVENTTSQVGERRRDVHERRDEVGRRLLNYLIIHWMPRLVSVELFTGGGYCSV